MSRPAHALAALLLLASPAAAGVLDSPPAFAGAGANAQCLVRNFDSQIRSVTVTLLDTVGAVIDGPLTQQVGAGSTIDILNTGGPSGIYVTCRFEGLTRKVKGWITVIDGAGTRVMLPAGK
ncbi:MAG TPA: hypothetical protein VNE71_06620 [Myxococcota bacterium]|jgi:hypothetical protein|nr:hypothetical protein [Myxococcota bacterium]